LSEPTFSEPYNFFLCVVIPNWGLDLRTVEVSRSHAIRHTHTRTRAHTHTHTHTHTQTHTQ